jgi:hypothetical protein
LIGGHTRHAAVRRFLKTAFYTFEFIMFSFIFASSLPSKQFGRNWRFLKKNPELILTLKNLSNPS